jgi:hypothetical protein
MESSGVRDKNKTLGFFDLPREIRDMIYTRLIPTTTAVITNNNGELLLKEYIPTTLSSMFLINRQLETEYKSTLYEKLTFEMMISPQRIKILGDEASQNPHVKKIKSWTVRVSLDWPYGPKDAHTVMEKLCEFGRFLHPEFEESQIQQWALHLLW